MRKHSFYLAALLLMLINTGWALVQAEEANPLSGQGTLASLEQLQEPAILAPGDSLSAAISPAWADSIPRVLFGFKNPREAWEKRQPREVTDGYYIVVRKAWNLLCLYKDGILLKTYAVGTGKNVADKAAENDSATPEGHFNLKRLYDSRDWIYIPPDKSGEFKDVYGPWFFAVDASKHGTFSGKGWTGIGIHGTNNPDSIGHAVSHGCIRMHNEDVTELKKELGGLKNISQVQVDILP